LTSPNCPDAETIRRLFASPDTDGPTTWRTEVRDNATTPPTTCSSTVSSSTFYSDASTQGQPAYDCNADGKLWVRAHATVRGRTRTMVALVQAERETQQLPRSALLAGRLEIGNNGNKVLVDAQADTTLNAEILVRCTPDTDSTTPCVGHVGLLDDLWKSKTIKLATQLNGTLPKTGYAAGPALSAEALERLRLTAITNGTYYATCPDDVNRLAGAVVYIETCNKAYKSNVAINTPESPGALIINDGWIDFQGNTTYHGLLYHANKLNSDQILVNLTGNNGVAGAVFVEKKGGFKINGSARLTVNGKAFAALRSYGSAGIIQNTWREIPPGP
jgi:hypothetical protein